MKISQREARRLRKRVAELERQERDRRYRWASEYPGGVMIAALPDPGQRIPDRIDTARALKRAVVVILGQDNVLQFYALPLATEN